MPDETPPIPPPDVAVSIENGIPQIKANYPFYQVIKDESNSLNIFLFEGSQDPPYYTVDFSVQAKLSEDTEEPLMTFTRRTDDDRELPPGTHMLKWTGTQEGILFSNGNFLSVETSQEKGIIVGDSTGYGYVPLPDISASFGWKGGIGWAWFTKGTVAVLTEVPSCGYGPAVYREISLDPSGRWIATGQPKPVILPKIAR